ncbi:hypothetical protein ACR6C2_29790 [Streptomyces sp. INA 01156]
MTAISDLAGIVDTLGEPVVLDREPPRPSPAPRTEFTGAPLLAGDEPRSGGAVGLSLPASISTSRAAHAGEGARHSPPVRACLPGGRTDHPGRYVHGGAAAQAAVRRVGVTRPRAGGSPGRWWSVRCALRTADWPHDDCAAHRRTAG